MNEIRINLSHDLKKKPKDESKLGFGTIFTDHMFIMNYEESNGGWHDPRIVPYGPILLEPSAMCFHYGQEVFEGLKAYRTKDDRILMFRPEKNMERLNKSNDRLCIPRIDEKLCLEGLKKLVSVDKDWVPHMEGTSLYLRPFIIATDPHLGVHPAKSLLYIVICSPVGAYYPEGLNPVKIHVETNYVRAVKGGMGFAKTGGNYAASLKAQDEAAEKDYNQVLWLDGVNRKYIEEVGAMNIFFVAENEIITPKLEGSILPGITRMSSIELLRDMGYNVSERRLSIDEVCSLYDNGKLKEVFGTGTAAVVSPVGQLKYNDKIMKINNSEIGPISQKLYDTLTNLQWGNSEDKFNWMTEVK